MERQIRVGLEMEVVYGAASNSTLGGFDAA